MASSRKKIPPRGFAKLLSFSRDDLELSHQSLEEAKKTPSKPKAGSLTQRSKEAAKEEKKAPAKPAKEKSAAEKAKPAAAKEQKEKAPAKKKADLAKTK